jgi:flavin-dependent dehydrogenase
MDVAIVGGTIAGLSLALNLHRQSLSLRAKRSNLGRQKHVDRDCFASLAMTG